MADPDFLVDDIITIAVQVNGKTRGTIDVSPDASQEDVQALALALDTVQSQMMEKPLRKFIYVPQRIANIVV